jgi:hypothetical protein
VRYSSLPVPHKCLLLLIALPVVLLPIFALTKNIGGIDESVNPPIRSIRHNGSRWLS